jgi:hypothetical protein
VAASTPRPAWTSPVTAETATIGPRRFSASRTIAVISSAGATALRVEVGCVVDTGSMLTGAGGRGTRS